mgnify:CR=1 FL=1
MIALGVLILAGLVYLGDKKVEKAGQQVPDDAELERGVARLVEVLRD